MFMSFKGFRPGSSQRALSNEDWSEPSYAIFVVEIDFITIVTLVIR
jgi:hypothetical protein